jgi:hypothetical protein
MSRPADPRFNQLIAAMKQIQQATGVSLRVEKREGNSALIELILRKDSDKLDSGTLTLRQILGLDLDATVFNLTFGLLPRNDKEVAMLTRSLLDIMAELATGVEVPASHETAGWVTPLIPHSETLQPLLAVRSGEQKPEHAFAAIPYQDHWYWIDNSDIQSKRTLVALMFFFSLTNSGDASLAPVVTINAGS